MKKLSLSRETIKLLGTDLRAVLGGYTGDSRCTEGWTCAAYTGCQLTPTPTVDTPGCGPGGFTATF